jgi:hypothetical protein
MHGLANCREVVSPVMARTMMVVSGGLLFSFMKAADRLSASDWRPNRGRPFTSKVTCLRESGDLGPFSGELLDLAYLQCFS